MITRGIDYSFARPAPSAIRAAGFRFAGRYLDPGSKGLTRAEAAALAAQGVWVICTYETTATWMLGGYSAGQEAGREARSLGKAAGMPDGRPVFFAADFDATPAQLAAVDDCLDGAASVLGRDATGIYGGLAAVQHAMEAGACHWAWQACAWSGGVWYGGAQVRQTAINGELDGQAIDYDTAVTADYGQWLPGRPPNATAAPSDTPPAGEDDHTMLLLGKDVPMPVAIPSGTRALRFAAAATASIEVKWRSNGETDKASLAWDHGAQEAVVPDGAAECLVTRTDAGTGAVAMSYTT